MRPIDPARYLYGVWYLLGAWGSMLPHGLEDRRWWHPLLGISVWWAFIFLRDRFVRRRAMTPATHGDAR
jgi:hypothetical protein